MDPSYLTSVQRLFAYYKQLGEQAIAQVEEEQLFIVPDGTSNSMAIIMQHLAGNMLSRWTDFLHSDGEKEWRQRDAEFEPQGQSKQELMAYWEKGWQCLMEAIQALQPEDLSKIVYIRQEPHTVTEAINRQLAHYPYHVGQLVFLAKSFAGEHWHSLSIPKHASAEFNRQKAQEANAKKS